MNQLEFTLLQPYYGPRRMIGSIKRCCYPSVRLSVCLSRFLISSRLLDGDMLASPFQTYSIVGGTVGYARLQMLSAGAYRFAHVTLLSVVVSQLKHVHCLSSTFRALSTVFLTRDSVLARRIAKFHDSSFTRSIIVTSSRG